MQRWLGHALLVARRGRSWSLEAVATNCAATGNCRSSGPPCRAVSRTAKYLCIRKCGAHAEAIKWTCISQNFNDRRARVAHSDWESLPR